MDKLNSIYNAIPQLQDHISNVQEPHGLVAGKLQKQKKHKFPSPPNPFSTVPNSQNTPNTQMLQSTQQLSVNLSYFILL